MSAVVVPLRALEPMEALVTHYARCQACQLTGSFAEWVICPEADALELQLGDAQAARLGDLINRLAAEVRWAARLEWEAERWRDPFENPR